MDAVPIVIDCGEFHIRGGFGGDSEPAVTFPSTGPRLKRDDDFGIDVKKYVSKFGSTFKSPIVNRTVVNFQNMEKIWSSLFQELKISPETHPILYTDNPFNPMKNRQEALQVFMETYQCPSVCPTYSTSLALYNAGVTSGIVVDAGESTTDIIPVYECFTLTHLIERVDVGGRHINDYMKKLFNTSGQVFAPDSEKSILREVKEQIGFVRGDPQPSDDEEKLFMTSEGTQIKVGRPRYQSAEVLFDPSLIGGKSLGIPKTIAEVIRKSDEDVRDILSQNILLSGGTSLLTGFVDRVEKGILIYNQTNSKVTVNAPVNRKIAAWVGGSLLSCVDTFHDLSITKEEYMEDGPYHESILELKTY